MKYTPALLLSAFCAVRVIKGTVYFSETFDDGQWEKRWVQSKWKSESELGHFKLKDMSEESDKALQTSEDKRFYAIAAKFDKSLNNDGKDLFITFLVHHTQNLDCGGAYLKLFTSNKDLSEFGGDTPYSIMFGPDVCGSTKQTHAILTYTRPNEEPISMSHNTNIRCESDSLPHFYSFSIHSDDTYSVRIDGKEVTSGLLSDDWPFLHPKEIADPDAKKPTDWVDDEEIPDPKDVKPENWDDIPKTIPDPSAEEPEDWDEEDDGVWEPPQIKNPEHKGTWKPKMIKNPEYIGSWEHPMIPNPKYVEPNKLHNFVKDVNAIGFDLWQVTAGTVFDDILVTDDRAAFERAESRLAEKLEAFKEKEKTPQNEEKDGEGDADTEEESEDDVLDLSQEKEEL